MSKFFIFKHYLIIKLEVIPPLLNPEMGLFQFWSIRDNRCNFGRILFGISMQLDTDLPHIGGPGTAGST